MNNNELYHHGILGMRWGVRRTPEELGHEIMKNDAKQTELAAKIAKMERKHELNPNKRYRKSEARLYKQAEKLKREREDLEMDKTVAEKWKAVEDAKREYESSQKAKKEAEQESKAPNSHDLMNKPLSQMSDKELADYLNRKANEQRYLQYNPPKKTAADKFKEFAQKNIGKAAQAVVDVGLDVGKEAFKSQIKKELENNSEKPNSNKKFEGKDISSLNDAELKKYLDRKTNEIKLKDALAGKTNGKGVSRAEFDELMAILQSKGYID